MRLRPSLNNPIRWLTAVFASILLCWCVYGAAPDAKPARSTNSLGMVFVPLPGTSVQMAVWETRTKDYRAFVQAASRTSQAQMVFALMDGHWRNQPDAWLNPGFAQGDEHPVCGVTWEDARDFCEWLKAKERAAGHLSEAQSYRLPTDAEWSAAAGEDRFPFSGEWPSTNLVGNYAGEEARNSHWYEYHPVAAGYLDGFPRTAPVGSFPPNSLGIHDLGGNVWEWCEDWYRKELNEAEVLATYKVLRDDGSGERFRVTRGASWLDSKPVELRADYRRPYRPNRSTTDIGFRCVLDSAGKVGKETDK